MRRIYKYLVENDTRKFIDKLDVIVLGLNRRRMSKLGGRSPIDITPANQSEILREKRKNVKTDPKVAPVLQVGDTVRMQTSPTHHFYKTYKSTFSEETYLVSRVNTEKSIPTYSLVDTLFGTIIIGKFYKEQLSRVLTESSVADVFVA